MKLYTEKEIVNFLKTHWEDDIDSEWFLKQLTPIELPSDEEIEVSKHPENSPEQELYNDGWGEGVKWLRDKIQGGNK